MLLKGFSKCINAPDLATICKFDRLIQCCRCMIVDLGDCKLILTKLCFILMNTFKINGSTMRTHSSSQPKLH